MEQEQQLLEEAKKRYPIGTKFYPAHIAEMAKIDNEFCIVTTEDFRINYDTIYSLSSTGKSVRNENDLTHGNTTYSRIVYEGGIWAKIVQESETAEIVEAVDVRPEDLVFTRYQESDETKAELKPILNTCKTCKHWKNEQSELKYNELNGFCISPMLGNASLFDRENIRKNNFIGINHFESKSKKESVQQSRYSLVTKEDFGCIFHEDK